MAQGEVRKGASTGQQFAGQARGAANGALTGGRQAADGMVNNAGSLSASGEGSGSASASASGRGKARSGRRDD
jgi:hypothetical protein